MHDPLTDATLADMEPYAPDLVAEVRRLRAALAQAEQGPAMSRLRDMERERAYYQSEALKQRERAFQAEQERQSARLDHTRAEGRCNMLAANYLQAQARVAALEQMVAEFLEHELATPAYPPDPAAERLRQAFVALAALPPREEVEHA